MARRFHGYTAKQTEYQGAVFYPWDRVAIRGHDSDSLDDMLLWGSYRVRQSASETIFVQLSYLNHPQATTP